ncbi:hypothetical protein JCGZ_02436 [Jatropha curcas]|uniref:Uncharacterized protein n=1 Tax=Jatropha curcas TaxID=180498 RepID=A0A067LQ01_JATCU|nr:hypothetical protein JCGZ_02436 [Jatropha curcas]
MEENCSADFATRRRSRWKENRPVASASRERESRALPTYQKTKQAPKYRARDIHMCEHEKHSCKSESLQAKVASATSICASARSTPERQRLLKHKLRARPVTSRAQVVFPGDVIAVFSSEKHVFACMGRDSSQKKSPQTPFGQQINIITNIILLFYK